MKQYLISSITGLSNTQYVQIPNMLGVWPFWFHSISLIDKVNWLSPERYFNNFKSMVIKFQTYYIYIYTSNLGTHCEITLRWMPQNLTNKKSTLVQVMAWCHQPKSHYLSLFWPKSMSWYGVIRLQWVNNWIVFHLFTLVSSCWHIIPLWGIVSVLGFN